MPGLNTQAPTSDSGFAGDASSSPQFKKEEKAHFCAFFAKIGWQQIRGMNKTNPKTGLSMSVESTSCGLHIASYWRLCARQETLGDHELFYTAPQKLFGITSRLTALLFIALTHSSALAQDLRVKSVFPPVYRHGYNSNSESWGQSSKLVRGMHLHIKDRIQSEGGTAIILCPSGEQKFKSLDLVQVATWCQARRSGPLRTIPGGQTDSSVPFLLEPRIGLVRSQTPTVRWNRVPGAKSYTISVFRLQETMPFWTSKPVSTVSITLPAELKLEAGEDYRLVVEADSGMSSTRELSSKLLHFGILPNAEAQLLKQELSEVNSRRAMGGVTPLDLVLMEAFELEQRDLITEAFSLLNRHEKEEPSLQGQLELGRLASLQGLNTQARIHFARAAALANQSGDGLSLREAREGEQRASSLVEAATTGTNSTTR